MTPETASPARTLDLPMGGDYVHSDALYTLIGRWYEHGRSFRSRTSDWFSSAGSEEPEKYLLSQREYQQMF